MKSRDMALNRTHCRRRQCLDYAGTLHRRHEQRSTVITTNLAYKQWGTVFPGAACVAALVDRFAQHCHVIDIDADSWRNKEATTTRERKRAKAKG